MNSNHYVVVVGDVTVRIDELNGHVGFGYVIGGRTYTGHASSVAGARRAIPGHVRRTLDARDRASAANAARLRDLRTIRSW